MRRWLSIFIIFAILINAAGCSEEWRRKFIRKKKGVTKKPRIYQVKKYKKDPTEDLYCKHYNYAVTWLSELADDIGQNGKKDVRCISEALMQVQDMQLFLVPEKAKELDKHIKRLKEVRDILVKQDLDYANKDYVRSTVEREERFLRREFYYNKIKDCMKKTFEEEELLAPKEVDMDQAEPTGA